MSLANGIENVKITLLNAQRYETIRQVVARCTDVNIPDADKQVFRDWLEAVAKSVTANRDLDEAPPTVEEFDSIIDKLRDYV